MARRTKKYIAAQAAARHYGLSSRGENQQLYDRLQGNNLWWNGQTWQKGLPPKPATKIIRIRVMAAADVVSGHADKLSELLQEEGYQLLDMSAPCSCRPPRQQDSRVYIQCLSPELQQSSGSKPKITDAVLGGN